MNNKGSIYQIPITLLMMFVAITMLIALLPAFVEMQNYAQQSDSLNCVGYNATAATGASASLSYNASVPSSTIGCLAIKLYVPYLVLGVLIAAVGALFLGGGGGPGQQGGGGGGGGYY